MEVFFGRAWPIAIAESFSTFQLALQRKNIIFGEFWIKTILPVRCNVIPNCCNLIDLRLSDLQRRSFLGRAYSVRSIQRFVYIR